MSDKTTDADLSLVLQLERELQTKACRNNRARVLQLLAPDFNRPAGPVSRPTAGVLLTYDSL